MSSRPGVTSSPRASRRRSASAADRSSARAATLPPRRPTSRRACSPWLGSSTVPPCTTRSKRSAIPQLLSHLRPSRDLRSTTSTQASRAEAGGDELGPAGRPYGRARAALAAHQLYPVARPGEVLGGAVAVAAL